MHNVRHDPRSVSHPAAFARKGRAPTLSASRALALTVPVKMSVLASGVILRAHVRRRCGDLPLNAAAQRGMPRDCKHPKEVEVNQWSLWIWAIALKSICFGFRAWVALETDGTGSPC